MSEQRLSKTFASLTLRGKVDATLRLLDHQSTGGVLPLSDEIYEDLRKKHPSAKPGDSSVTTEVEIPFIHPAQFANIDETTISKAAMNTNGDAGPSGLDAIGWRHILLSRNYGDAGKDLRSSLASMSKKRAKRAGRVSGKYSKILGVLACERALWK